MFVEGVEAEVDGDAVDPAGKRGWFVEGFDAAIDFEEDFLRDVFGFLGVAHESVGGGEDSSFVLGHQALEGAGVVGKCLLAPAYKVF